MYSIKQLSSNRLFIYHLLRRALKHHCPISAVYDWDIEDVYSFIQAQKGEPNSIGMTAVVIKATADTLKECPRLNSRIFHTLFGKPFLVNYEHISCATVVARMNEKGEETLMPLILKNTDQLSIREIQHQLEHYKTTELGTLEKEAGRDKMSKLPGWLVKLLHFKFRSDPKFTEDKIGSTYAVSSVIQHGTGVIAGHAPSNQTSFYPSVIDDKVMVVDREPVVRTCLTFGISVDHYVVDGRDVIQAAASLKDKVTSLEYLKSKLDQP